MSQSNKPTGTAQVKITKKQIDETLAAGIRHAKFQNKGVQKRLMKNQEKVLRQQERRETHFKTMHKKAEKLRQAQATGHIHPGHFPTEAGPRGEIEPINTDASGKPTLAERMAKYEARTIAPTESFPEDAPVAAIDNVVEDNGVLYGDVKLGDGSVAGEMALLMADTPPPSIPVVFDAETKGLVITPADAARAVEESIERVQDGVVSPAPLYKDILDGVQKRVQAGSSRLNPIRHPLNLYGDAENYKPFPAIGEVVREDGLFAALRAYDQPMTTEVDYANDRLVYAEPGQLVTAELFSQHGLVSQEGLPVKIDGAITPTDKRPPTVQEVNEIYAKADEARATDGGGDEMVPATIHAHIRDNEVAEMYPHQVQEIASYSQDPKAHPTGQSRLNPENPNYWGMLDIIGEEWVAAGTMGPVVVIVEVKEICALVRDVKVNPGQEVLARCVDPHNLPSDTNVFMLKFDTINDLQSDETRAALKKVSEQVRTGKVAYIKSEAEKLFPELFNEDGVPPATK